LYNPNLIAINKNVTKITMENNKDIKIETDEDIKLDDNIRAGARALGKAIKD
jgi:hypothetical protein